MGFGARFSNWLTALVPVVIAAWVASAIPQGGAQAIDQGSIAFRQIWYPVYALAGTIILAELVLLVAQGVYMPRFSAHRRWIGRWVSVEPASMQVSIFEIRWRAVGQLVLSGTAYSIDGTPQESWDSTKLFATSPQDGIIDYSYTGRDLSGNQHDPLRIFGFCRTVFSERNDKGLFSLGRSEFHEADRHRATSAAVSIHRSSAYRIDRHFLATLDVWSFENIFVGLRYNEKELIAAVARIHLGRA